MRILLFMLAGSVMAAGIAAPAAAQNYPWCEFIGSPGGTNCGFISFEQCMESARGNGGSCRQNTQYTPPPGDHGVPGTLAPRTRKHS